MAAPLLDITEARERVLHAAAPLPTADVPGDEALGRVLAEEVRADRGCGAPRVTRVADLQVELVGREV